MQHIGGAGEVEGLLVGDVQQFFLLLFLLVFRLLLLLVFRLGLQLLILLLVDDLVALAPDVAHYLLYLGLGLVYFHVMTSGVGLEPLFQLQPIGLGIVVDGNAE